MSANQTPPDFDEDFLLAIKNWREKYKIQEGDTTLLLLELFRIHQDHWDELRRRQMPSLDQFRNDVAAVTESAKSFRSKTEDLIDALLAHPTPTPVKTIPLTEAKYAAATSLLGGLLIGLALGKLVL